MGDKPDLLTVLEELAELTDDFDAAKTITFFEKLKNVYSINDYRHSYFEISEFLESRIPEVRDILEERLEIIYEYAGSTKSDEEVAKRLFKLCDHIALERLRLARMDKIKYMADKLNGSMSNAMNKIEATNLDVTEAENKVNNIHSETITILGIFAGLVIGFATGFQLFAESFTNLNDIYFYKIISYLAFIGIILFDCIFFLMFSVSRVSRRSLALNCKYKDCAKCAEDKPCKTTISKIHKKYSYVFWFNLIMFLAILFCVFWEWFIYRI